MKPKLLKRLLCEGQESLKMVPPNSKSYILHPYQSKLVDDILNSTRNNVVIFENIARWVDNKNRKMKTKLDRFLEKLAFGPSTNYNDFFEMLMKNPTVGEILNKTDLDPIGELADLNTCGRKLWVGKRCNAGFLDTKWFGAVVGAADILLQLRQDHPKRPN